MTGDEIDVESIICEGCGGEYYVERPAQGPVRRYHSPACRKAAFKRRQLHELAMLTADEARAASHDRLATALASLGRSSVVKVRDLLSGPAERKVSPTGGDGLCSPDTTQASGVVGGIHNEEG